MEFFTFIKLRSENDYKASDCIQMSSQRVVNKN